MGKNLLIIWIRENRMINQSLFIPLYGPIPIVKYVLCEEFRASVTSNIYDLFSEANWLGVRVVILNEIFDIQKNEPKSKAKKNSISKRILAMPHRDKIYPIINVDNTVINTVTTKHSVKFNFLTTYGRSDFFIKSFILYSLFESLSVIIAQNHGVIQ